MTKFQRFAVLTPLIWQALEIIADLVKVGIEDIALVFNGKKLNEDKVWAWRFFFSLLLNSFLISQTFAENGVHHEGDAVVNPLPLNYILKKDGESLVSNLTV